MVSENSAVCLALDLGAGLASVLLDHAFGVRDHFGPSVALRLLPIPGLRLLFAVVLRLAQLVILVANDRPHL